MTRVIRFELEGGGEVLVESSAAAEAGGTVRAGAGLERITEKAQLSFEQALERVRPAVERVASILRESAQAPDAIGLEFGIKLSSGVGAVIAAVGTEANFKITLTWSGPPRS